MAESVETVPDEVALQIAKIMRPGSKSNLKLIIVILVIVLLCCSSSCLAYWLYRRRQAAKAVEEQTKQ